LASGTVGLFALDPHACDLTLLLTQLEGLVGVGHRRGLVAASEGFVGRSFEALRIAEVYVAGA
jgi:hypothetical protein